MSAIRASDERGGAIVEFAIFTLVFVPLAMYGIWIGDVMHLGVRAEEASITPAFDATAALVHDFVRGGGTKVAAAVSQARTQQLNRMQTSFDASAPSKSSVAQGLFARPSQLTITCNNQGPTGGNALFAINKDNGRQPTKTYVTCAADLHAVTATGAGHFASDFRDTEVGVRFAPSRMFDIKVCGVGPGWTGCAAPGGGAPPSGMWGLPIYLDDWGTELGDSSPLQNTSANKAYYQVASKYYRGGVSPAVVMTPVAALGDLAPSTGSFRMSYIRDESNGSYAPMQNNAGHGGPATQHMGGEWHSESTPNLAQKTFSARSLDCYMAVPGWPRDR
jgi:hypothetical protein